MNKGRNKKRLNKKREKRIWSAEEENALVDILYEMNGSGWKADTGHKCGYMTYIEKELAKRFPNANIKVDPHIQSEVKKLKKMLSYALDIQQHGSGFGWDDERKMVVGDLELFNDWAKVDYYMHCCFLLPGSNITCAHNFFLSTVESKWSSKLVYEAFCEL